MRCVCFGLHPTEGNEESCSKTVVPWDGNKGHPRFITKPRCKFMKEGVQAWLCVLYNRNDVGNKCQLQGLVKKETSLG